MSSHSGSPVNATAVPAAPAGEGPFRTISLPLIAPAAAAGDLEHPAPVSSSSSSQQPHQQLFTELEQAVLFPEGSGFSHNSLGSLRTPAGLSHEGSALTAAAAAAAVEASCGSQHLLPNLLLSQDDYALIEEISRTSSAENLHDLNPSYHSSSSLNPSFHGPAGGLLAGSATPSKGLGSSRTSGSWSSLAGTGGLGSGFCNYTMPPASPGVVKAAFSDACLPSTPKSCSHSNLRVMASRNQWQQGSNSSMGGGGSSGGSSSANSNGSSAGWAAGGQCGDDNSSCCENFTVPSPGSSCGGSSAASSFKQRHSNADADPAGGEDDEDSLLAEMHCCLGSLQTAAQLARADSQIRHRPLAAAATAARRAGRFAASAPGSYSTGALSALAGNNNSSSSNSSSRGCHSVDFGCHSLQGQQVKGRLQLTMDAKSSSSSAGLSVPAAAMPKAAAATPGDIGGRGEDGVVLLKIGSRGRPMALPELGCHSSSSSWQQQQQQQQQQHASNPQVEQQQSDHPCGSSCTAAGSACQQQQQQQLSPADGCVRLQLQQLQAQAAMQQRHQQQQQLQLQTAYGSGARPSSSSRRQKGFLGWLTNRMGDGNKIAVASKQTPSPSGGSSSRMNSTQRQQQQQPQQLRPSKVARNSSGGSSSSSSSSSQGEATTIPELAAVEAAVPFAPQPPSAGRPHSGTGRSPRPLSVRQV